MAERIVTRTVIGSLLMTNRALNLKHNIQDYTTINQAISLKQIVDPLPEPLVKGMEVLPEYSFITDSDQLFTQVMIIGNGGHKVVTGTSGNSSYNQTTTGFSNATAARLNIAIPYTVPVPHRATDTGLFNMYPFVIRPVTDDLTIAERKRYCLRRTIEIDGVLYAAYFGRVLTYERVTATTNITEVVDGQATTVEFVPTFNNLLPTHPTEDTDYNASYGNVSAPLEIVFDEDDIQDLKDACRLLYNNENYALLSEISLCSAVQKPIEQKYPNSGTGSPTNVAQNTFFEMVACQVVLHMTTYVSFIGSDQEYSLTINIGATEPLFGAKSGN